MGSTPTSGRASERLALGLHVVVSAVLVTLLGLPVVALVLRVPPGQLLERLRDDALLEALRLSLLTSVFATLAVTLLGLPIAYLLATRTFPGKRLIETMLELPMVLPPTVAGVGLLLAFGRQGLAGATLAAFGLSIPFTTLAVVVAQVFVAAPFFIAATRAGLTEVDQRYLDAAATLRSSPSRTLFRVMLPLAFPSLLAGAALPDDDRGRAAAGLERELELELAAAATDQEIEQGARLAGGAVLPAECRAAPRPRGPALAPT